MMALLLWQTLALAVQASRNQQLAHETATLNAASEISRNALLSEEYSDLLPYIQSVPYVGGVSHAFVADHRNIVVASTDLAMLGKPAPPLESTDIETWRSRDITNENEKLGTLAIKFSNAKLFEAIKDARNLGVSIAITGMGIIAVIGTLMGYLLTRRLETLTQAAQRVAAGDLRAKAGLQGDDEVAEVGRAFDQMTAKIQDHISTIEDSNIRFSLAVAGSNDGIWDWNIVKDEAYFSPRWQEMLGAMNDTSGAGSKIADWYRRIHPDDHEKSLLELDKCLYGDDEYFALEHRLQKKTGDYIWVLMRGKVSRNSAAEAVRMTGSLSDITDRKLQESTIEHQALHDSMTDLPNRAVLQDRLQHAIHIAERQHEPLAVLMIDLDRFKEINDTLGHQAGDTVLQEVAARLSKTLRKSDTVARFGGDEFAIILLATDTVKVIPLVNHIFKALEPPVVIDQVSLNIDASIGIALYPLHGQDPTSLIKYADIAMYVAKRANSGYAIYNPSQDQHSAKRLNLTSELRQAIAGDELVLHYQPKIDLRSGQTVGVEALVRWEHPTLGLLFPDAFIPVAERCGLIKPLTEWVLNVALRQQRQWEEGGIHLPVAINLSTRTLHDMGFPIYVRTVAEKTGLTLHNLEFEITESAIMADPASALKILTQLNEMGIRLSIDDFGTGYSSLAYLQKLPVHAVKIDKSFVMDMVANTSNIAIIRSTLDLGHNLGLQIIAEGVENIEACSLLKSMGCDIAQGYYFSRPIPAERMMEWITKFMAENTPPLRPIAAS